MSITISRSPRKYDFYKDKTPLNIGPGLYDTNTSFTQQNRENVAPFNTMVERKAIETVNDKLGPGTYNYESYYQNKQQQNRPSSNFVTQAARFCPSAPGSSIFKAPTYVDNPAPGTYYKEKSWQQNQDGIKKKQTYDKFQHKDLVVVPQQKPPSIPSRKLPQNAFLGIKDDKVGPGCYDTKDQKVKKKPRTADFYSSKTKRQVFEPNKTKDNFLPSKDNPGPGQYDYSGVYEKKNFNEQGQSSMFLSKVPNCKDIKHKNIDGPSPGQYQTTHFSDQSFIGDHKRSTSDSGFQTSKQEVDKGYFIGTTKRDDFWKNNITAPFTKPTNFENPGPGKYINDKKKNDIRQKILQDDSVKVPFGSSDERNWNKKIKQGQQPGPGQYIDINNPIFSSISKPLLKFKNDRTFAEAHGIKVGPFGSNVARFENPADKYKSTVPGPGQYTQEVVSPSKTDNQNKSQSSKIGENRPNTTQNAFFKSTTERFVRYDSQNPNVIIIEKGNRKKHGNGNRSDGLSVQSTRMGSGGVVSYLNQGQKWTKKTRADDYEQFAGKKVGFDTTQNRFSQNQVFCGQSLKFGVPGPGQYNSNSFSRPKTFSQPRNKHLKNAVVFNTCEKRFKYKGNSSYIQQFGTTQNVGPGSYGNNQTNMIKKSFNMTMENSYFM